MKTQAEIIRRAVQRPYVQRIAARKGWGNQKVAEIIVEFIACKKNVSLFEFLEGHK